MQRFFSTSRQVRRIPPNAPARIKQIPIPRTARTTAEISEFVPTASAPTPNKRSAKLLDSMLPELSSVLTLQSPAGVWYSVARSRSGNLPVYTDYNNAGHAWTEVRKISGNAGALRNDLKKQLNLKKEEIWVKNSAQTIVIKGNVSQQVKRLLATAF